MLRAARGPLLILVLIALLLAALWFWVRTSLPEVQGRTVLPGLARSVEISRDEFGVPSIEAQSQEDLYYALGYVHAQDRLWQMEYRRLRAAGRLAELLGEDELPSDVLLRTLGLRQVAERDLGRLSARASGVLQAYSDGINAYLATRSGALPLEFQLLGHTPAEWAPVDVVMLQKLTAWQWSSAAAEELFSFRLLMRTGADQLGELLGGEVDISLGGRLPGDLPLAALHGLVKRTSGALAGGQAWALGPERTADGAALLAVEARGPLTAPAPWYLVRLRAPGMTVAGATLPGLPLLFSGRNGEIAWALVPTPTDNADLFLERLVERGDASSGYLTREGAREFDVRREHFTVRGADDVDLVVRESIHGPVLSSLDAFAGQAVAGDEELVVALSWTALAEGDATLQAALALPTASDGRQFSNLLSGLDEFHGTALYADTGGTIGWHAIGRRPQRLSGSGSLPFPGRAGGWDGWLPFTRLEGMLEPERGFVLVGGVDPVASEQLITSLGKHTVLSAARILGTEFEAGARELLPVLSSTVPATDLARRAHAALLGWNGEIGAHGVAALLFSAWKQELGRQLFDDELGAQLAGEAAARPRLISRALEGEEWCDDHRTDEEENCAQISSRALTEAAATLAERYGPELSDWPGHPDAAPGYEHPVFGETLLAPLFTVSPDGDPGATASPTGPVYRAVFELASEDEREPSGFAIPTGESGNPLSRYYRNLAGPWDEGRLLPLLPEGSEGGARLLLEPRR